ncbi:putative major capsid protein [Eel River basin pequenovirus]|nr:putative major capsid protein [Eel River basin pequenovirus]
MRSVMEHSFSEVPRANIPRSTFNRSHGLKTTFDADWLIPILVDDVIPGDTFNVNMDHVARLGSPLSFPIMDNLFLETFYFFVPYRLVWDNWEKFCGAREDPSDSIDYTIPKISSTTNKDTTTGGGFNELATYMGLPYNTSVDLSEFSALPFRAYNLIFNEWFRDQNLTDSAEVKTTDGPDAGSTDYTLLKRAKRHDYFTSCLPWPQKGDAVTLPLSGFAPVLGIGKDDTTWRTGAVGVYESDNSTATYNDWSNVDGTTSLDQDRFMVEKHPSGDAPYIRADLSQATAATINDLRLAFQTQRLLERDARSGTRYNETILAHFGVTVPDFRVQRPEFLGGGSSVINVNQVASTYADGTQSNVGDLSAFAISSGRSGFTKSFTEHGVIIGLANVRGDITYSQGAERYWYKETRYDFYYPVLAQIGEQAVENREIFYQNTSADHDVFGYQERYAEYRYKPSRLTGLFNVDRPGGLDSWHLSEDFSVLPTLGNTFIESATGTPLDRALAVPSEPQIIADFYFDMKCARPMPLYGVPGNLDHF